MDGELNTRKGLSQATSPLLFPIRWYNNKYKFIFIQFMEGIVWIRKN
jgi:hypothetical protein